eukprot:CCRYP_014604-RB/>CCRYP_014604-RB protein AED:0.46 eAED:0.65 QI:0/-1/0/1/-1/0/1/0/131
MGLTAHSDASYLSETNTRSCAGGHFFLSENYYYPTNNGAAQTIMQIIKAVMSSATEAKLGALYINALEVIPLHHLFIEIGHGHAFPLALLLHQPKSFLAILACWRYQLSRLCHQASPHHPSSSSTTPLPIG